MGPAPPIAGPRASDHGPIVLGLWIHWAGVLFCFLCRGWSILLYGTRVANCGPGLQRPILNLQITVPCTPVRWLGYTFFQAQLPGPIAG